MSTPHEMCVHELKQYRDHWRIEGGGQGGIAPPPPPKIG